MRTAIDIHGVAPVTELPRITLHTYASNMGKRKSGETVHPGRDCQCCARCGTTAEIQLKEELKQWVVSALELKSSQSFTCVTNVNNNDS